MAAEPGPGEAPRSAAADARLLTLVAVLVAVLLGGATAWRAWDSGRATSTAATATAATSGSAPASPTPTVDAAVLRVHALDELLAVRSRAVLTRDRAAWMATVDPLATDLAGRQGAVFDNLAQVPLGQWRYEFVGQGPALPAARAAQLGPDAWVARVLLVYRLADADQADVRREQSLTMVRRGPSWLVAADTDGATSAAVELWDLGPVSVLRGQRSLVLGTADPGALQQYAEEVDAAAARVDEVWGTAWPRTVVVQVPQDQTELAALLARPTQAGLEQIAAVTTGTLVGDQPGATGDRVIVNPDAFARLGSVGRDVVLTHEITHVATRATTAGDVPIWLSEGFADYVAYHGTGLSRAVVAQDVLDQVRAGQGPAALPTSVDFDAAVSDVAPAYSGAWLAAELIERTYGQEALVTFYRAVSGGFATASGTASGRPVATDPAVVDVAFAQVLGIDAASFEQQWLAYLADLAR